TPGKQATLLEFNHTPVPAKRGPIWGKVQQLVYDEVPYIDIGKFNSLSAKSTKLENYQPALWPFFWNVKLKN
ncbi:MAG: ABC transporter substrate-binding protein, partial [Polaromonas sp.]|nr:ABC transporter substrate-binding protein [Polaromonas sp.]